MRNALENIFSRITHYAFPMSHIGIIKFQLAGIQFGMDAERILEIVRLTHVRNIPRPLPYVVGLTGLRKYIVTVIDFRRRLGLSPLPERLGATMIVARIASKMLGLLVESISEFRQIPESQILPPLSVAGFPEQLLTGVIAEKGDILILPDLDAIFSSFLKVQLLPITSAEKIAFQYRFTPGSLIRTLENTLIKQHVISKNIVHKLPRSMCVPSVLVHKTISYYSDFLPQDEETEQEGRQAVISQKTRAGDETYLSLSQQLLTNQETEQEKVIPAMITRNIKSLFTPDKKRSSGHNLEALLHHPRISGRTSYETHPRLPEFIASQPHLVKQFARALRLSPLFLTKYISYYTSSGANEEKRRLWGISPDRPSLDCRLRELLSSSLQVEEVLQILGDEQQILTLRDMQWLAQHYQISLVKIAKLCLYFPGLTYESETEEDAEQTDMEIDWNISEEYDAGKHKEQEMPSVYHVSRKKSVSECLWQLAQHNTLFDNRIVRSVAASLHIPTCRLSKLRSYYKL